MQLDDDPKKQIDTSQKIPPATDPTHLLIRITHRGNAFRDLGLLDVKTRRNHPWRRGKARIGNVLEQDVVLLTTVSQSDLSVLIQVHSEKWTFVKSIPLGTETERRKSVRISRDEERRVVVDVEEDIPASLLFAEKPLLHGRRVKAVGPDGRGWLCSSRSRSSSGALVHCAFFISGMPTTDVRTLVVENQEYECFTLVVPRDHQNRRAELTAFEQG